jgi:succinyl-CoA synthetase beta subunit
MAARQVFRQAMRSQLLTTSMRNRVQISQARCLNLHEYQSKELMRQNGLTVQKFATVGNADQVDRVLGDQQSELFNCDEYVVKAQVLAGGRGKGHFLNSKLKGGVKLTREKSAVKAFCGQMLNDWLVTAQTGSEGELVRKLMIAEALDIEKELYLAIVLDRDAGGPLLVACEQGTID